MTKMTKKSKKEKKRKEAIKQKKAKTRALPKLLRNEALLEALSSRLPLVECLINKEWREHEVANVLIVRDGPAGLVFAYFLVDLADSGLRDAWGSVGASPSNIEAIKTAASRSGFPLVPCDEGLAERIVHSGQRLCITSGAGTGCPHLRLRKLDEMVSGEVRHEWFASSPPSCVRPVWA
jgi:hypothetical protein